MLISLHVKNVALIDEVEVYFNEGLNILSGETGAGKSILIGSINLALGERAETDLIRTGASFAFIELVFQIKKKSQIKLIQDMDIPVEEDGMILLQRRIMPGRSICKVCGEMMPIKKVRELAAYLIHIHGQMETQSLFDLDKQREFVDLYAGIEMEQALAEYKDQYTLYIELKKKLAEFHADDRISMKEYDLATYELNEIINANLQIGEDELLETSYRKMKNNKNIMDGLKDANFLLGEEDGVVEQLARILRSLRNVLTFDESLEKIFEMVNDADSILSDASREILDYMNTCEFTQDTFLEVENRLNLLNHLKDKYGNTIEDIFAYMNSLQEKIERLENKERYLKEHKEKLKIVEDEIYQKAEKISNLRKINSAKLQEGINKALLDLNFQTADFEIALQKKECCNRFGQDEIVFMISTNPGEPLKPLSTVASGGELSRIMLALKTVMARNDAVEAIIFDEIDAGVSGKTAWKVSEKLAKVSKDQQVICITHLPQIAAMADAHYLIEKTSTNLSTQTKIQKLEEKESLSELARMLGGETITDAAKENAKEMKVLAERTKNNFK